MLMIITSMPLITPLDFEEEIRKFSEQSPKLPPINKANCSEKVCSNDGNFYKSLTLPEISTAVRLSRRKIKKKVKKAEKCSSEVPTVKKRRVQPIRRMQGETTVSFSVVSSASGSRNIVIQRKLSPGSVDRQEADL